LEARESGGLEAVVEVLVQRGEGDYGRPSHKSSRNKSGNQLAAAAATQSGKLGSYF